MIRLIAVFALWAGCASAQVNVTNHETEGNLKPTHHLKCIAPEDYQPEYSPADLATGLVECLKQNKLSEAGDLIVELQVRGRFDMERVKDRSAHQGVQVLLMSAISEAGARGQSRAEEAMEQFGGVGSPRHDAACKRMKAAGPPQHSASYMVQHGMAAFTGLDGDGLVVGFNPKKTWRETLSGFFGCS